MTPVQRASLTPEELYLVHQLPGHSQTVEIFLTDPKHQLGLSGAQTKLLGFLFEWVIRQIKAIESK